MTGNLGKIGFQKIEGVGTSGSLYLVMEASGADTVNVTPWLTYTAPLGSPVGGIYSGSIA